MEPNPHHTSRIRRLLMQIAIKTTKDPKFYLRMCWRDRLARIVSHELSITSFIDIHWSIRLLVESIVYQAIGRLYRDLAWGGKTLQPHSSFASIEKVKLEHDDKALDKLRNMPPANSRNEQELHLMFFATAWSDLSSISKLFKCWLATGFWSWFWRSVCGQRNQAWLFLDGGLEGWGTRSADLADYCEGRSVKSDQGRKDRCSKHNQGSLGSSGLWVLKWL